MTMAHTASSPTPLLAVSCLFIVLIPAALSQATGDEVNKLYNDLHDNKIHRHLVPVKNTSGVVQVLLGAALINFEGLDETNGILHLNIWVRMLWKDEYMSWDPASFGGVTTIRMPLDNVWNPDITLYNKRGETELGTVNGVIYNDGSVLYIPPARTKTHCSIDMTYFPYDKQTCVLKFGSWTYDGNTIDLEFYEGQSKIDLSDYIPNAEWDIVSTSGKKTNKYYPCCEEPYPDIKFNLTIQRKTSYYTYIYVGPAVVLSLLAPFIFLLPPGDQQKMTLGVGILVCFTLFFMEMATSIPTIHSHTPLIDKYYMTVYVLLCVAMALSTLVSNLARRTISMRHPPEIIKKVMLSCLGRCLCVSGNMYDNLPAGDDPEAKERVLTRQTSTGGQVKEWLLIATVVDRLLFLVYLILTILLTIIILSCRG